MRGSILGFYGITVVGVCTALPIQSVVNGDRNVILLGALVFLSFGAVLAGCVCCRRRKKGFEEFRNESGTPEAKTEYPIFRALSPESQRNVPLAEVAVNNSNENLIEDDFDNNNGPISPADLENIENNNAGDYIQNLNEVGIDIEPSVHSINRNLANASGRNVERAQQQPPPELQNVAISSTNHFLESITVHSSEIHSESVVFAKNDKANNDVDSDESPLEKIQVENLNSNPETLPVSNKLQISYIDSVNLEEKVIPARNSFDVESSAVIEIENCNDEKERNYHNVQIELETTTPDESSSIKSGSSDKSGEISSVEEALRALDCAIAGESSLNSGCEDDEDDLTDEDFECNDTNFQNVIRQLLINNGVNSILPDLSEDQININNLISDNVNNLEHIQTEAELLVDSIINESQKIVAERSKPLNNESEYPICNNTIIIANCNIDTNNCFEPSFLPIAKNYDNEKSEFCTNSPLLTPCESIEDFFTFKPLEKTSTPFMQNKFTSQITSESIPNTAAAPGSRKKLLEYNDNVETSPVERSNKANGNACNETIILNTTYASPNTENDTFTFPKTKNNVDNQTFAIDKTFEISPASAEDTNKEFIHPCDPCTSKQAIERDCNVGYPSIVYDREETNSEDMTTITPVNTPIELNYSNETWTRMTKNSNVNVDEDGQETGNENEFESNGWFLHPQVNNMQEHDTFDVEGDDANLELAYKALRKQLAEVLPQPQGISGPPEYSDDEDDAQQNRTFDEYRSPLDDQTPAVPVQNELFINYKRALTPILEESEEETCKTFVMNETKCLDSTSTGCVDTGEAIMGVTKTLMASNDTLFNFEDTLGEREDVFSPRTPTRTELKTNTPTQSCKSNEESSIATLGSEKFDSNDSEKSTEQEVLEVPEKRTPPKTIDIQAAFEFASDNDLCSPEQQKTFSEGTNSSTTDRISSDISGTVEHDTTFTTNTNDEKTCVTVIIKDDERISEISEPEWGSTASYGGYEMNSLTDVPSLDYNIINFVEKSDEKDESNNSVGKNTNLNEIMARPIVENTDTEENGQEDSGNSTHASVDDRTSNSDNTFDGGETQKCDDEMKISISSHLMNQEKQSPSNNLQINLDDREKCRNFLLNEIQVSSSQNAHKINEINKQQPEQQQANDNLSDNGDVDSSKENTNPNIKVMFSHLNDFDKISYQKVQTNSQDAVIVDKSKNNTTDLIEKDLINGVHENIF